MSQFTSHPEVFSGNPFTADEASPTHQLGEKMFTPDGRAFRYCRAGATALVIGNLLQAEAEDTGEQGLTPEATAIGATTLTTNSTVTVDANEYEGGYIVVTITPGLGQVFKIKSHPAASAAALTLTLEDPVQTALTTTSRIDIVPNLYRNVIQKPAAETGSIVGVACNNITAAQYGWIQVEGPASCLADGALVVGNLVVASDGTAGAVEAATDASTEAQPIVGVAITGVATTENGLVNLKIG